MKENTRSQLSTFNSSLIPPGYKQTEVGVIPEDWDVSTVGHEFDVKLGKMLDSERNIGIPKPYIGNRSVQWGRIDTSDLSSVPMSRSDLQRFRLLKGDLMVCEGGEVGRAAIWEAPMDECYYQKALHRLRPLRAFDVRLMAAILRLWSERGLLVNYVTQTSIAHLPREKFLDVPIPRPPLPEQRAIATALGDVDALLEGLDRFIAKKRDLKQAAMQALLSPPAEKVESGELKVESESNSQFSTFNSPLNIRLPGFEGEWEVKRLGDYVTFLRNGVNSRAELTLSDPVKYLHYGDIHACSGTVISPQELPSLPSEKTKTLHHMRDGDLIFADASEDMDGVGKSVEICNVGNTEVVAGLHTIAARFDKVILADGFKAYLQFCPEFLSHLHRLAAGTKVYATNRAHIASVEMQLPDVDEQTAIATILSDMDAEIEALEQRHAKTRDLKQAMMQELLTGRVRLVSGELKMESGER